MSNKPILYGDRVSPPTNRVLLILEEKEVDYDFVQVSLLHKEHKEAEYVAKLHPFGKIPALQVGNEYLCESAAIGKYICKKYAGQGTKLMPDEAEGPMAYGQFEKACAFEACYFTPLAYWFAAEMKYKVYRGSPGPDAASLKEHHTQLEDLFKIYEGIVDIDNNKWLGGKEMSFADLAHVPYGAIVYDIQNSGFKEILAKYPKVEKWLMSMLARPIWKGVYEKAVARQEAIVREARAMMAAAK